MTDDELMARLEAAAVEAIRNERPGLCYDRSRLKGITLELEVRNNGSVISGEAFVNRTANIARILDLNSRPRRTGEGVAP